MARSNGCRARAVALSEIARPRRARRASARLSVHRQQSRRGGAGQAPHRRRSSSAISRRRWSPPAPMARGRTRRPVRRICARRNARSSPGAMLAELILQRAQDTGLAAGSAASTANRRGRADPARRLAVRPQGNADRRRAACFRPRARRRVARGNARRAIGATQPDLARKPRRLRRGGNATRWSMR